MEKVERIARERELSHLYVSYEHIASIMKAILNHKKIKFMSVLEDADRLRGYERANKDLLILFCMNREVATRTFKNISEMLNDTYKINHKATLNDLTIELI